MANLKPMKDDHNENKINETDLNKSLDILDQYIEKDLREKQMFQERCKSVFSINTSCKDEARKDQVIHWSQHNVRSIKYSLQIPENNLQELNKFQARIKASMDRLDVPSWYKQTSHGTSFLSSSYSTSSPPSWKSSIMTSSSTSSSSSSSSGHWKTIRRKSDSQQSKENIPKNVSNEVKTAVYCGWRKSVQNNCNLIVSSPSQRLAKTLI